MGKRAFLGLFDLLLSFIGIIFGILAIGGSLASRFHPAQHMILQWLGLLLPFILLANMIFMSYSIYRKRLLFLIPLCAILLNISYLSGIYQWPFKKIVTSHSMLNIATYNIQRISGNMYETSREIADFMEREKVDILCLQEFPEVTDDELKQIATIFGFLPHYVCSSGPGSMQLALFSRYPILRSQQIVFPGESKNSSLWADIVVHHDAIRVVNNHLQTTNLNQNRFIPTDNMEQTTFRLIKLTDMLHENAVMRADQADIISGFIDESPYPLIICGDFNDTPASYTYRKIKGDLEDSFRSSGKGYGYTYRYLKKLYRIDYLLYSGSHFRATGYDSPDLTYSDHKPVITSLELKTKPLSQEGQIQK